MGQTEGSVCQGKGAISQSPAGLPSLPSALGSQTLPEALGGDLNILYSRPQPVGVGGKRRGQSGRVSSYNSAPPPPATLRLLRLPAAPGIGHDPDTTIQAFARPEPTARPLCLEASHCEETQTFLQNAREIPRPHKYPYPCFPLWNVGPQPSVAKRGGGNSGQTTNPAPTATCC